MKSLLLNYIYDPSNKENNKRGKEQEIKEWMNTKEDTPVGRD